MWIEISVVAGWSSSPIRSQEMKLQESDSLYLPNGQTWKNHPDKPLHPPSPLQALHAYGKNTFQKGSRWKNGQADCRGQLPTLPSAFFVIPRRVSWVSTELPAVWVVGERSPSAPRKTFSAGVVCQREGIMNVRIRLGICQKNLHNSIFGWKNFTHWKHFDSRPFSPAINSENGSLSVIWPSFG